MLCEDKWLGLSPVQRDVLILVLMEDALRGHYAPLLLLGAIRLNPCSNGRCSARMFFQCGSIRGAVS